MIRLALILGLTTWLFPSEKAYCDGLWTKITRDHARPILRDGFDETGLLIAGSGLVLVAVSQNYDYRTREEFSDHKKISADFSRAGDLLGSGGAGALIALGQLQWDSENGVAHAEALLSSFAVTSLLKQTNQRGRPGSDNHHSMPSGHTSTAFTTATHLSYAYGWKAAVPSFLVSTFVAATRWSDDAHWLSDTVAGATIGVFWGRATWFHHNNLSPIVLDDGGGLGLGYNLVF